MGSRGQGVGAFLIHDSLLARLRTGRAQADLLKIKNHALWKRWTRVLVFGTHRGAYIRDQHDGQIRLAESDDETDMGSLDPHLDYINPLWKLQLAQGPRSPMQILAQSGYATGA